MRRDEGCYEYYGWADSGQTHAHIRTHERSSAKSSYFAGHPFLRQVFRDRILDVATGKNLEDRQLVTTIMPGDPLPDVISNEFRTLVTALTAALDAEDTNKLKAIICQLDLVCSSIQIEEEFTEVRVKADHVAEVVHEQSSRSQEAYSPQNFVRRVAEVAMRLHANGRPNEGTVDRDTGETPSTPSGDPPADQPTDSRVSTTQPRVPMQVHVPCAPAANQTTPDLFVEDDRSGAAIELTPNADETAEAPDTPKANPTNQ